MSEYIPRLIEPEILTAQKSYPVILVTGPRQSGKSTLCRHMFPEYKYVNLENITERVKAQVDPTGYLESLGDKAVIDEIQNVPEILSMIQVRVDEYPERRYVITGSCNFTLMRAACQSLAGRVSQFTLYPFSFPELGARIAEVSTPTLMLRGCYAKAVLGRVDPFTFYTDYYNTYVERDMRDLLKVKNLAKFDKFVRLLAVRTGSELNMTVLAKEVGVTAATISEWVSLLSASYLIYSVRPYHGNIGKRLTKMPKVYFSDTGLLCYLLGIEYAHMIEAANLKGVVFENMAMNELLKQRCNAHREPRLAFYKEHSGREVDAMVPSAEGYSLYEIKAGQTLHPQWYDNMKQLALELPVPSTCTVIYDGTTTLPMALNVRSV